MQPKIFIASPLFNPPQIEIIERIESILEMHGYQYYSARKHSGSDKMTPEQRKDIHAWDPVFDSNEHGLDECRVMIAVLEWAFPEDKSLQECFLEDGNWIPAMAIELPDAGTVWECGYHRAQGKIVLGFHTDKAKHLNLMLSHGCDALIRGFDNLEAFLADSGVKLPTKLVQRSSRVMGKNAMFITDASGFDWSHCESWDAATKEVE